MSNSISNISKRKSSPSPTNGRQTVGDGAPFLDSVLAVCHVQGADDMYYYSTTFSGGPGVSSSGRLSILDLDNLTSGGFDIPHEKCPPDGGSSGCVTGSPASSLFSSSPQSAAPERVPVYNFSHHNHIAYPPTPESSPSEFTSSLESLALPPAATSIPIPTSKNFTKAPNLLTPPYTPDDVGGGSSFGRISARQSSAALDFLTTLFPRSGLTALPYAKSVSITSPALEAVWEGIVLNLPGGQPTLYVNGKGAEHVKLRESIVALLDLADEHLECTAFVIGLERSSPALGELLHALMYVGGTVVTKPPFEVDPAYVLVGIEI